MKFSLLPRSYVTALLLAFAIVIAPLVAALVLAVNQIQLIAKRGETSLAKAAQVGEQSRSMRDALQAMERTVRQAGVLGGTDFVETYARNRLRFWAAAEQVAALGGAPPDGKPVRPGMPDIRLDPLERSEQVVYSALQAGQNTTAVEGLPPMQADAEGLMAAADQALAGEREAIAEHPREVLRDLGQLAILVMPLAVGLAAISAWALGRPVRTVAQAIRKLGEGQWNEPIEVRGQTEIARLGPQLDWLRRQLVDLEAARSRLLQQVSHDLKTPLAAITEGRSLLAEELYGPLNARQHTVLELIERNCIRQLAQINALMRAAAIDAAAQTAAREKVDLKPLVERVIDDHKLALDGKRMSVEAELANATAYGHGDQIRMIVDNRISNGSKYAPDGSRIMVRLESSAEGARIEVADDGPGLAPGEEERVFDPAMRGSAAVLTRAAGSGMGLAIARDLARAHGGRLYADPDPARRTLGACFVLTLPPHDSI
ncbi:HAMP domain-containing sensor histidine kinase [soil metagenome]